MLLTVIACTSGNLVIQVQHRFSSKKKQDDATSVPKTNLTARCAIIGFKKMFRKLLKNTEPTGPKLFSVCFIGAMVCVPLPTFFAVFRHWRTKLMRRENWKV